MELLYFSQIWRLGILWKWPRHPWTLVIWEKFKWVGHEMIGRVVFVGCVLSHLCCGPPGRWQAFRRWLMPLCGRGWSCLEGGEEGASPSVIPNRHGGFWYVSSHLALAVTRFSHPSLRAYQSSQKASSCFIMDVWASNRDGDGRESTPLSRLPLQQSAFPHPTKQPLMHYEWPQTCSIRN